MTSTSKNLDIIIADWVCCAFTVMVIMLRIILRFVRRREAYLDDYWVAFSMILIVTRGAVMHYTLVWGSNNVSHPERLSADEIRKRQLGSQLTLSARVLYLGFVWIMKYCMVIFYQRLTARLPGYPKVLLGMKIALALTFIGVLLSTFLECRPFNHYWQVLPTPGVACTQSQAQLLTMGILNLTTDLALIIIPLPLIFKTGLPLVRKLQLAGLFSVGIFVVAITIMKMPIIVKDGTVIRQRALWASVEMLACCIVVNFPILVQYYKTRNRDSRNLSLHHTGVSHHVPLGSGGPLSPRRLVLADSAGTGHMSIDDMCYDPVMAEVRDKVRIETRQEISQMIDHKEPIDEEKGYSTKLLHARRENVINTEIWTDRNSGSSTHSVGSQNNRDRSTASLNAGGKPKSGGEGV